MEDQRNYADKPAAAGYYDRAAGGAVGTPRGADAGRVGEISQRLTHGNVRLAELIKRTHRIAGGLVGAPPLDGEGKDRVRPPRMGQLGMIEDAADGTAMLLDALETVLGRFEEGLRQG